jgi:hypothetical protein
MKDNKFWIIRAWTIAIISAILVAIKNAILFSALWISKDFGKSERFLIWIYMQRKREKMRYKKATNCKQVFGIFAKLTKGFGTKISK